jgi:hypothetical protein
MDENRIIRNRLLFCSCILFAGYLLSNDKDDINHLTVWVTSQQHYGSQEATSLDQTITIIYF